MFDIGFWELVVIGIVALLIIGPEKLPGFARTAGHWISKLRRFINSTRRELEQELGEHSDYTQNLSSLDDLIKDAPDRAPGFNKDKGQKDTDKDRQ